MKFFFNNELIIDDFKVEGKGGYGEIYYTNEASLQWFHVYKLGRLASAMSERVRPLYNSAMSIPVRSQYKCHVYVMSTPVSPTYSVAFIK